MGKELNCQAEQAQEKRKILKKVADMLEAEKMLTEEEKACLERKIENSGDNI